MRRRTIADLRRERGLTQRELAQRIGVSRMSVYHWEAGRNEPSARQLRLLAEAFAVPMEAIAFEREAARAERQTKQGEGHHDQTTGPR
jgi:transcriptional regulator with XRE-family HTH domain